MTLASRNAETARAGTQMSMYACSRSERSSAMYVAEATFAEGFALLTADTATPRDMPIPSAIEKTMVSMNRTAVEKPINLNISPAPITRGGAPYDCGMKMVSPMFIPVRNAIMNGSNRKSPRVR